MHTATKKSSRLDISSEKKLKEFAERFAQNVKKGDFFFLYGEMGVGKTTFVKYFINNLQLKSNNKLTEVTSPTFNIMNEYILDNFKLNNPYKIEKPLIQTSQDPRIQAEGKAGQSTDKGIIFVSETNFESEAGSEWVIGTCVKSPCVAAGNNELISAYR